jgi:predicted O-methyltransferase YrrM
MKNHRFLTRALVAAVFLGGIVAIIGAAVGSRLIVAGGAVVMFSAFVLVWWWYSHNLSQRLSRVQRTVTRLGSMVEEETRRQRQLEDESVELGRQLEQSLTEVAGRAATVENRLGELSELVEQKAAGIDGRSRSAQADLTRRINALPGTLLTEQQALDQLLAQYPPRAPLPIVAGWAMAPTGLLWLADLIERTRPELVVECGSGTTTLWMSLALERAGSGRLISLEHSDEFAGKTRELLTRHGVGSRTEVRLAPLVDVSTARGVFSWYDVDAASFDGIDVLVVDGPPGSTGPHARYPALPVFIDRLKPSATIIADDVDRKEEQQIVQFWLEEDSQVERTLTLGGQVEVLNRK